MIQILALFLLCAVVAVSSVGIILAIDSAAERITDAINNAGQ